MQRKESKLVLSLDYDGCLAGSTFNTRYHAIQDLQRKDPAEYQTQVKSLLREIHQPLIQYIHALIDAHQVDEVIVMVGSNRQLAEINKNNQTANRNGSCYEVLPLFAEVLKNERIENVSVHPYTLGDSIYDQPAGCHFNWEKAVSFPAETDRTKDRTKVLIDYIRDKKHFLLYQQILLQCSLHPDADVVLAFIDDLPSPLISVVNQFSEKGVESFLPSNLKQVEVVCYQDDKNLRALPGIIESYLKHGELRIKSFFIKDTMRLIDALTPQITAWIELTDKYQHEIEALQAKHKKLLAERTHAAEVYRSRVEEKMFSVDDFKAEFDKTRRSVEEFLDSRQASDEQSLKYKKASISSDSRDFVSLLNDGAFVTLLNANPNLRQQVKEFSKLYKEKKSSVTNSSEVEVYQAPLTHIEAESLIIKLQLNALLCVSKKNLQELEYAKKYLASINEDAPVKVEEMMQCLHLINAAMIIARDKTHENIDKLNDNPACEDDNSDSEEESEVIIREDAAVSVDLKPLWKALKAICNDIQTKLLKDDNDKLHRFYASKVEGRFAIQLCDHLFSQPSLHGRFVRDCMTRDIWCEDNASPGMREFNEVLTHAIVLDNLQTLLSSEPYVEYCQDAKGSKTLKKISDLLANSEDRLSPMQLLAEIKQIATEKVKAKNSFKGKVSTFFNARLSGRKSVPMTAEDASADNRMACFMLLAECDSSKLLNLMDMNSLYANLKSQGAEFFVEKGLRKK